MLVHALVVGALVLPTHLEEVDLRVIAVEAPLHEGPAHDWQLAWPAAIRMHSSPSLTFAPPSTPKRIGEEESHADKRRPRPGSKEDRSPKNLFEHVVAS